MTTRIIETAEAKLLCKLSRYFITSEMYVPPNDKKAEKERMVDDIELSPGILVNVPHNDE